MSVLIVGASGFVGGELKKVFGAEAVGTYCRTPTPGLLHLDITNQRQILDLVERLRPRLIIHPAAQPNVDRCETEVEESYQVNVAGTRNVAAAARRVGARYVYFSTDYVFDGTAGPYLPDAEPGPLSVYARHKLEAEQAVRGTLDDYLIARVCGVYGYHPGGKNFIMGLIARGLRQEPMKVPADQWGTPTFVENLAAAVRELALSGYVGVVHPVGPDYVSRIDFARLAAEILELRPDFLCPVMTADLDQPARRPLRGGVDNRSTQALLRTRLVGVREGLEVVKQRWRVSSDDQGRGADSAPGAG
jgi:dTDP-4-dehydrorhamnose reductase